MKLELKHIAPYLPYGLKYVHKNIIWDLTHLDSTTKNREYKPILRPLSDLTKEIEVNGEKFVPIEKIAIYGDNKAYLEEAILTGLVEVIVFNMLLRWHFDLYNLIENGIAIDINTL